jgi:hypothetical protein
VKVKGNREEGTARLLNRLKDLGPNQVEEIRTAILDIMLRELMSKAFRLKFSFINDHFRHMWE